MVVTEALDDQFGKNCQHLIHASYGIRGWFGLDWIYSVRV